MLTGFANRKMDGRFINYWIARMLMKLPILITASIILSMFTLTTQASILVFR